MVKIRLNDVNTVGSSDGQVIKVSSGSIAWTTLTKTDVGLANVDNTSDANKPVSTATQTSLDLKAPINNPTFTGTVGGITKAMVGLANVDNTSDANKPVSSLVQTALDLKAPLANPTFTGTVSGITKAMVGLGNVDNTSDSAKPVSTATQTALDLKAPLASPAFTGTVTGVTKAMVGLGNVDNTSDTNKPVSTATQSALDLKVDSTLIGAISGIATLDGSGKVPSSQLPSYVDDVLEYADFASLPVTGESGKIYITTDNNSIYRWSGSLYIEITSASGTTDSVAEGTNNLYFTTARARASISTTQNLTYDSATGVITGPDLSTYAPLESPAFTGTVTGITSAMVGLGSVDNTSDADKPISTSTQSALDGKQDELVSGTTIKTINGESILGSGDIVIGNSVQLDDLTDVVLTSPAVGQYLNYNGSSWINAEIAYADISGTPTLATIATTGNYSDLIGAPTLATVATSGSYNDLTNKPALASVATSGLYSDLSGTPTLATVATSGAYADLTGKPTLSAVATSGSYNDLSNKPTIPTNLDSLTDVTVTTPTNLQILQYNGTAWVNATFTAGASALDDLSDVVIVSPSAGDVLLYNAGLGDWENSPLDYSIIENTPDITLYLKKDGTTALTGNLNLNTHKIVGLTAGTVAGDAVEYAQLNTALALKQDAASAFSGSYTDLTNKPTIPTDLNSLTDVTITGAGGPLDGQVLVFDSDSGQWVNSVIISEGAAFFTEITAIGTGVSQDITLPHSGYTDDLIFVSVNGLLKPTGEYSISGTTLTLTTNAAGDDISVRAVQIGSGTLSTLIPSVLTDLSDVAISTPSTNQLLQYDGTNWVNTTLSLTTNLDGLTDVIITSPTTNQLLKYNGTNWVNSTVVSLPAGGSTGQVLAKNSATDGDASWTTPKYNTVDITTNATTSYTLIISDVYVRSTSSSATVINVPANSAVAYNIGTQISIIQAGTGQLTITPGSGVTVNKASPATFVSRTQFSVLTLTKVGTNEWDLAGDMVLS